MKRFVLFIAGICAAAMTSCSKGETENTKVESITVENSEIYVCTRSAFNPVAFGLKIIPGNISEDKLVYSTSDESIVRLKEKETLAYRFHTGDKTGVATLTCASADGEHKVEVRVNVVENPRYDIKAEKIAPSDFVASDGELKVTVSVDNKTNRPLKEVTVEWRTKFSSDSFFKKETITDIKDNKFVFEKKGLPECVVECTFRMKFDGLVDMPGKATRFTNDYMVSRPSVFKPEDLVGNWYASKVESYEYVNGERKSFFDTYKPTDSGKENFTVCTFGIVNEQVKITVLTDNADGSKTTDVIEGALQSGNIIESSNKEWRVEILYFSEKYMICNFTRTTDEEGVVLHKSCELEILPE